MSLYQRYLNKNQGKTFPIYAYSPPPEGKWWIDDQIFTTEDFRTVERYQEYKECGFNVLFMQRTAAYNGEDWSTCETKAAMEKAVKAGLDKIIIVDERIFALSTETNGLIGEGKKFATEQDLDDFIRDCIKDYKLQEGFYGVQLMDEPFHPRIKAVGQVFKAVRRVDSSIFVHCNLNPMIIPHFLYQICPPGMNMIDCYEKYLTMFLEESGSDYIMMDIYPFYKTPEKANISKYYFAGLECVARVCKKYGKEMHIVMQSFGMNVRNKPYHLLPNEQRMQYQKNVLISFGVKEFAYFTYWTKQANNSKGEMFPDGKAMMNRQGERTPVWYYVQKINEELNELAPLLSQFEYKTNAYFVTPPLHSNPTYLEMVRGGELSQVTSGKTDRDVVLVSELYDKKKRQYMHCVVNVADPKRYAKWHKKKKQLTTLCYAEKYNVADVYKNEKWKTVVLKDGKLELLLSPGEGAIVLPYRR